jgi:hypothetical protein
VIFGHSTADSSRQDADWLATIIRRKEEHPVKHSALLAAVPVEERVGLLSDGRRRVERIRHLPFPDRPDETFRFKTVDIENR